MERITSCYWTRAFPILMGILSQESCDPPAIAGDDTMGPPVVKPHQMLGLAAGWANGERPRWAGPKRNIACAGSMAYWGSGSGPAAPSRPTPEARDAEAGQTQCPASHSRLSLQSWSLAQGTASTWAQPNGARPRQEKANARARRREAGRELTGAERNGLMAQG